MTFYQKSSRSKQVPTDSSQHQQLSLPLAIEDAPRIVRRHGLQEAHAFPLVSRGKSYPVHRKPAYAAQLQHSCHRVPNSPPL